MTDAQRKAFERDGYLLIEGAYSPEEIDRLRAAVDRIYEEDRRAWEAAHPGERYEAQGRIVRNLLERDPAFWIPIAHPRIWPLVQALFDGGAMILSYNARVTYPGSARQPLHQDAPLLFSRPAGDPLPEDVPAPLLSANFVVYLDDLTPDNGPLRLVPGSHRFMRPPSPEEAMACAGERALYIPAGTAVLFHAATWHGSTEHLRGGPRRGVFVYHGWYWLRQRRSDMHLSDPSIAAGATPEQRQALGLAPLPGVREAL